MMINNYLSVKIKYFFYILLLFCFLFAGVTTGQDNEVLFNLYFRNDMTALRAELDKYQDQSHTNIYLRFYGALFLDDGEEAKNTYQDVFDRGGGRLKLLAAERLYQYYYAKGYYVSATKYQKYVAEHELPITAKSSQIDELPPVGEPRKPVRRPMQPVHHIQVGAFGIEENAVELSKMLKTQNIESRVVKRQIGENELYCVWIPGKPDFEDTLDFANTIKIKYDLNFRIIKE